MINAVIAEDEPLLLENIRRSIEEAHSGFRIIGQAGNGEEALSLIKSLSPDVLFTDIRMPLMDGISLINEIRNLKIDLIPIIISGYNDFEYAKMALKLGVYDYLLKPLSMDILEKLLEDVYDRVEYRKKNVQLSFLRSIVNNEYVLDENMDLPQCLKQYGSFSFMILHAGSIRRLPCSYLNPSKEFWVRNNLDSIVLKYISSNECYWILDAGNGNEKILILPSNEASGVNTRETLKSVYGELEADGFPVTAVVGKDEKSLMNLASGINGSRIQMEKHAIYGKSGLFDTGVIPARNETFAAPLTKDIERMFYAFMENRQINLVKQELKRILDKCENNLYSQIFLESQLKNIIRILLGAQESFAKRNAAEIEMEINELVGSSYEYKTLFEGLCLIIDNIAVKDSGTGLKSQEDKNVFVSRMKEYIIKNYTNKINLQAVSSSFGIAASLMTKLYKENFGITPNEHIIKLRIDKAKELLAVQPQMLLKDISEIIGYDDPFYMSRIFKSITGKSPSEYREGLGNG